MNEAQKAASDSFETNRSTSALLRDSEANLAKRAVPLIDLRTVPREQWDRLLDRHLVVPPTIASLLAGELMDGPPVLDVSRFHAIEEAVEKFYGITEPYYVTMDSNLITTGKAWTYVPEVAPYVSGFIFGKDEQ